MAKCSVCEKPVPAGVSLCSTKCMVEAGVKAQGRISDARQKFFAAMNKMLEPQQPSERRSEESMIKLKHRWLRNRNLVSGSVILSFNGEGIALVPDVGNSRLDVDACIRSSRGLIEYVVDEPAAKPVIGVPKPEPKKPVKVDIPEEKVEVRRGPEPKVHEEEDVVIEPAVDRSDKPITKSPVKKSPIKKK